MHRSPHDGIHDTGGTERIPDRGEGARPPAPLPGPVLFLYHRDGIAHEPLHPGRPLVVGRSSSADLCVSNSTLSREHARFSLVDGRVTVEDLGSTNGTWIANRRIEGPTRLSIGGDATLGEVIAHVFAAGTFVLTGRTVDSDAEFRRRLDEEIDRARLFHRHFALLAVRAPDAGRVPPGAWITQLHDHIASVDRVNLYTPDTALVLLMERPVDKALAVAKAIAYGSSPRLVGIAMFPSTATTADALVELAHEALSRARPNDRVGAADPPDDGAEDEVLVLGERLREVYASAERAARSSVPVLLSGETGTGKEVLAHFIHGRGPRQRQPFVPINCGAIAPSLMESVLFGHEKGAFTGADRSQPGCFQRAHRGTLFLDEVGELSPAAQVALLRVLEDGSVQRVGGAQEEPVDVRVIAATHRDLRAMVDEGDFREDLLYRLNTFELTVPPLRERKDEIEQLCRRFVQRANRRDHRQVRRLAPEAMALLRAHDWPGNVRELRNAIDRAVALAEGDTIQPADLPPRLLPVHDEQDATVKPRGSGKPKTKAGTMKADLEAFEAQKIEAALRQAGGNQTKAAELLDMPLRTLVRRVKEFGLKLPRPPRKR